MKTSNAKINFEGPDPYRKTTHDKVNHDGTPSANTMLGDQPVAKKKKKRRRRKS